MYILLKKIQKVIFNPLMIVLYFGSRGYLRWISDRKYVEIQFKARTGRKLNLEKPVLFNEKLNWLKLYDKKDIYKQLTDKLTVRDYVKEKIGEEYLIPLIGSWNKFDDINFDELPDKFVLKCTHDSGSAVICNKELGINKKKLKKFYKRKMNFDYYWGSREWNYKGLVPKIIAEEYMVDESGYELKDYKIFTFGGKAKVIQVDIGRFTNHFRNFYDTKWEYLNVKVKVPTNKEICISKPSNLDKLLELAETLSAGIPHVRVDFYIIDDKIYFGELTFHHAGAQEIFEPHSFDIQLGNWIELPCEI